MAKKAEKTLKKAKKSKPAAREDYFLLQPGRLKMMAVTASDLCAILQVSQQTLGNFVSEGVITKADKGQYMLLNSLIGWTAYMKDRRKSSTATSAKAELDKQKALFVQAQREEKTGILRKSFSKETVSISASAIAEFVADLHSIPARITRDPELREKLEKEFERIQEAAAKRARRRALGVDDDSGEPGAAETSDD